MGKGFAVFLFLTVFVMSPVIVMAADVMVTPSVGLKGEYNDNIEYTAKDEQSDYIGSLLPGMKLEYRTPRFSMEAEGKAEIQRYLDKTENNTEKYGVSVDAEYLYAEGSKLFGEASFTRDTTLDQEFDETGLVKKRENRNSYTGGVGFLHALSARSAAGLAYKYQKKDFSGDLYTDSDQHNIAADFNYIFNDGIDTLIFQPLSSIMDSDLARVNQYGAALGLVHKISNTLEASVKGGALYTEVSDKITDEDTTGWGWIAEADLKKRWQTFALTFGFSRQDMFDSSSALVTVNRFSLSARYDLTERFSMNLTGAFYLTKSSSVANKDETDERSYNISPKLSYRITENIALDLAYTYSATEDRLLAEDDDRDRNQVWLLLTFEFPSKL